MNPNNYQGIIEEAEQVINRLQSNYCPPRAEVSVTSGRGKIKTAFEEYSTESERKKRLKRAIVDFEEAKQAVTEKVFAEEIESLIEHTKVLLQNQSISLDDDYVNIDIK